GAPRRSAEGLRSPRATAVRRRLYELYHRIAGGAVALSGRAHARVGARVGILVGGQHLQGGGRRLGHHGRRTDDRRYANAGRRAHREAADFLTRLWALPSGCATALL